MYDFSDRYPFPNGSKLIRHSATTISPYKLDYSYVLDLSGLPPTSGPASGPPNGHHSIKGEHVGMGHGGYLKTSSVRHTLGLAQVTLLSVQVTALTLRMGDTMYIDGRDWSKPSLWG